LYVVLYLNFQNFTRPLSKKRRRENCSNFYHVFLCPLIPILFDPLISYNKKCPMRDWEGAGIIWWHIWPRTRFNWWWNKKRKVSNAVHYPSNQLSYTHHWTSQNVTSTWLSTQASSWRHILLVDEFHYEPEYLKLILSTTILL
jgi:hypothetical protein